MDLPTRVFNMVIKRGSRNSYEALFLIKNGLLNEKGIGEKTREDCKTALAKFVMKVKDTKYENINKISVCSNLLEEFDGNLVKAFPEVIDLYLSVSSKKNYSRNSDVLKKRFSLQGEKIYSLTDIGVFYELSRERVRQIESKAIREINLLLTNKIKKVQVDEQIVKTYSELYSRLNDNYVLINQEQLEGILVEIFGECLADSYRNLLMEICGYVKLPSKFLKFRGTIKTSWCSKKYYKEKYFQTLFQSIDVLFDKPEGMPIFDLIVLVKKSINKKIDNDLLMIALSCVNEIEQNNDRVHIRFNSLRNIADKAFRVLEHTQAPMHYSKLMSEINMLSAKEPDYKPLMNIHFTNQLVLDDRFVPIGKSGEWGLKVWNNLSVITILEAIKLFFHKTGKPQKYNEIKSEVLKYRPDASENSIKAYLGNSRDFVRVGRGTFALASWKTESLKKLQKNQVNDDVFIRVLKEVFSTQNPAPFPTLISIVRMKTGLAEISVRQRVRAINGLDIRVVEGQRYKEVYCENLSDLEKIKQRDKKCLRDQIQSAIKVYLNKNPNIPITKGNLYKIILKNISCSKPIYYHSLSKMEDIVQYQEDGNYYVMSKVEN